MGKGLSLQQHDVLARLEANWVTDVEIVDDERIRTFRRREMLPVRDLRDIFLPADRIGVSAARLASAESSCRRSLRALERRGLVELWRAPVYPTTEERRSVSGMTSTVLVWRVHWERRPGETAQLRCAAITDAGLSLIQQA